MQQEQKKHALYIKQEIYTSSLMDIKSIGNEIIIFNPEGNDEPSQIIFRSCVLGIYGGAELFKKPIDVLPEQLKQTFRWVSPDLTFIWQGCIYSRLKKELFSSLVDDYDIFHRNYHQSLYERFKEFSFPKQRPRLIYITADEDNYSRMYSHCHWPFIRELFPHESKDGCFHGLLFLKK